MQCNTICTAQATGCWLAIQERAMGNQSKIVSQKMVSTVSFLLGGDLSIICFCMSMKLSPLCANILLRLITESSLYLATARSACSSSYLYVTRNSYTQEASIDFPNELNICDEWNKIAPRKTVLHTLDEHQSGKLPS